MGNDWFYSRPQHDWEPRFDAKGNKKTFCGTCNKFYQELEDKKFCLGGVLY